MPLVEKNQVVSDKQPRKQPRKQPEKSQEIEHRIEMILSLIQDDPTITRKGLSERLNLTEQQVRTAIENLKKKNVIYHEGPNKGGKWIIIAGRIN